jgi:hypothetical protein
MFSDGPSFYADAEPAETEHPAKPALDGGKDCSMAIVPLGQASNLPPLSPVSRVERVVRRPKSAKDQSNAGSEDREDETPIAAMRTPAEASSSAIQDALTKLELGG